VSKGFLFVTRRLTSRGVRADATAGLAAGAGKRRPSAGEFSPVRGGKMGKGGKPGRSAAAGGPSDKTPVRFAFRPALSYTYVGKVQRHAAFAPWGRGCGVRCMGVCMPDMHRGVHP
jgi:hypothetical protein